MNKKILGAVLSTVLVSGSAQAAVITDSFLNALETTEIDQTNNLDKFDTALGSLTSAKLTISGESISESILTNNASGAQTFSFESALSFFFDVSSVGLVAPTPAFTTALASTGGFITLAAGFDLDLGETTDNGSFVFNVSGAALNAFKGAGTFDVGCTTLASTNFTGGGGNIANDQDTVARCGADIMYTYDQPNNNVPEPASLALMGLGLGLLGFARRNKKA